MLKNSRALVEAAPLVQNGCSRRLTKTKTVTKLYVDPLIGTFTIYHCSKHHLL